MMEKFPDLWLERTALATPEAAALVLGGENETGFDYKTLNHLVTDRAERLQAWAGDDQGMIGIVIPDAFETLINVLAAFRAGLCAFPINAKLPADAISQRLQSAGVERAIASFPLGGLFRQIAPEELRTAPRKRISPNKRRVDAPCLIIGTSGSTGQPKGVMLSAANLAAAIEASGQRISLHETDCWAACLPLSGIGGLSVPLRCLKAGACCLLYESFDAKTVARDLEGGRISHISLVPAMLAAMLDLGVQPSKRLAAMLIGGAALSPSIARRAEKAGWPVLPSYGMSETASQTATFDRGLAFWKPGLAGRILPGLDVRLLPSGRISVKGPMVMVGYANKDLRQGDGLSDDGWFETSDLGRLDAKGELEIIGRTDHMLISGGHNVSPEEIESLAALCPNIREIAITGRSDPVWGDLLVALYVGDCESQDVLDWCKDNIPSALRPRDALRLDRLPLLASGKIDRGALRALAQSKSSAP